MSDFIHLEDIRKFYTKDGESIRALEVKELILPQEGIVLVTGKSGSGKTTLLNMAGLLDKPTSGKIMVDGKDVSGLGDSEKTGLRRQNFGFVFQAFNLIPTLTVVENIALPLLSSGLRRERVKEIDTWLERVGLGARRKHLPGELSQGEQQRAAIVRALVNSPKAILADEPISNLDSQNAAAIVSLLAEIAKERKILLVIAGDEAGNFKNYPYRELRLEEGRLA